MTAFPRNGRRARKAAAKAQMSVAASNGDGVLSVRITGMRLVNGTNERGMTRGAVMLKANRIARQRMIAAHNVIVHGAGKDAVRALLPAIVTITRVAPRKLDLGNLWAAVKPVQDGIADAFGVDDREGGPITWRVFQRSRGVRVYGCEILIEPRIGDRVSDEDGATATVDAVAIEGNKGRVVGVHVARSGNVFSWFPSSSQLRAFVVQCEAALEKLESEQ